MDTMSGLHIILNIFILLHYAHYMNGDCFTKQYKVFPTGYNLFIKDGVEPYFKSTILTGQYKCGQFCVEETFCHMWSYDNGKCQIFHSMKDNFKVSRTAPPSMLSYYETAPGEDWLKMYSAKNESQFIVGESFLGAGTYNVWGPTACTSTLCPDLFRNNLITVWNNLPIDKVKLSARTGNKEVVSMIFNGKNSTNYDWFTMARVLESPWADMYKGAPYQRFMLSNHAFYAPSDGTLCPKGCGWFVVVDNPMICPNAFYTRIPKILYSNHETCTNWTEGHAEAEELFVFVSLK